jgi:hypothetical protein
MNAPNNCAPSFGMLAEPKIANKPHPYTPPNTAAKMPSEKSNYFLAAMGSGSWKALSTKDGNGSFLPFSSCHTI